jgi:hypothetical protein
MAHGYLGDGYGIHGDFDEDRDRERERDWRDEGRSWRERSHRASWRNRDRGMMFEDRDRSDEDRWDRGSYGPERGYGGFEGDYSGDYSRGRQSFSANPDDHYRSWRDRHMTELDRDYADYCREREQQFHQDFDSWRNQRRGTQQPLRTGMTQTGLSADPSGMTQAATESQSPTLDEEDPLATATLGTTSEGRGRGRR